MAAIRILCEHRAVLMKGKDVIRNDNGTLVERDFNFWSCKRCDSNWKDGDPVPDVAIARLESVKSVPTEESKQ